MVIGYVDAQDTCTEKEAIGISLCTSQAMCAPAAMCILTFCVSALSLGRINALPKGATAGAAVSARGQTVPAAGARAVAALAAAGARGKIAVPAAEARGKIAVPAAVARAVAGEAMEAAKAVKPMAVVAAAETVQTVPTAGARAVPNQVLAHYDANHSELVKLHEFAKLAHSLGYQVS